MRNLILNLATLPAALALQGCGPDRDELTPDSQSATNRPPITAPVRSSDTELRDGFTLVDGITLASRFDPDIPNTPYQSWSFMLSSDLPSDELERIFRDQAEDAGYEVTFETDTGFAAKASKGREMSLMMLELDTGRTIQLLFSKPRR